MKKRNVKVLTLSKETLGNLDHTLQVAQGGFVPANPSTESFDGVSILLRCTSCYVTG
jgi:hypothetical protein